MTFVPVSESTDYGTPYKSLEAAAAQAREEMQPAVDALERAEKQQAAAEKEAKRLADATAARWLHPAVLSMTWENVTAVWRSTVETARTLLSSLAAGQLSHETVSSLLAEALDTCWEVHLKMQEFDVAHGAAPSVGAAETWHQAANMWRGQAQSIVRALTTIADGQATAGAVAAHLSLKLELAHSYQRRLRPGVDDHVAAREAIARGAKCDDMMLAEVRGPGGADLLKADGHPMGWLTWAAAAGQWKLAAEACRADLLLVEAGKLRVAEGDVRMRDRVESAIRMQRQMQAKHDVLGEDPVSEGRITYRAMTEAWRSVAFIGAYAYPNIALDALLPGMAVSNMDFATERAESKARRLDARLVDQQVDRVFLALPEADEGSAPQVVERPRDWKAMSMQWEELARALAREVRVAGSLSDTPQETVALLSERLEQASLSTILIDRAERSAADLKPWPTPR